MVWVRKVKPKWSRKITAFFCWDALEERDHGEIVSNDPKFVGCGYICPYDLPN